MVHDVLVASGDGAHDELADAGLAVLVDAGDDVFGGAYGEVFLGVDFGDAALEAGDCLLDFGVVPGAEVVADAGAEMVGFVVGAAGFG